jgi:hypothetical protein
MMGRKAQWRRGVTAQGFTLRVTFGCAVIGFASFVVIWLRRHWLRVICGHLAAPSFIVIDCFPI